MFFVVEGTGDSNTALAGGGVAVVLLVVVVISTVLVRRRSSGRGQHPKRPKSGVTADPKTHLKRSSKIPSARKTPPSVSYSKEDEKVQLGPNPKSVQTSPTKDTVQQERQASTRDKSPPQPAQVSLGPPLPDHTVLIKDKELRANAKDLAGKTDILEAEYRSLLGYVTKNINKTRTVAQSDENRAHNRYTDIGKPYSIKCKYP